MDCFSASARNDKLMRCLLFIKLCFPFDALMKEYNAVSHEYSYICKALKQGAREQNRNKQTYLVYATFCALTYWF